MSKYLMKKIELVLGCLVLSLAMSCGSDSAGGGPRDDDDDDQSETGVTTPNGIISIAQFIYDGVDAGEDMTPYIEGVFEAFDLPIIAADDTNAAHARVEAGEPVVTTRLVEHMATAYADRTFIGVEGYFEGLAEQGVGLAFPFDQSGAEPGEYAGIVGSLIYGYWSQVEGDGDVPMDKRLVLPSLVRALGQERARRAGATTYVEPIWGDNRLDPLQFTLLTASVFQKPAASERGETRGTRGLSSTAQFQTGGVGNFIKDQIKDKIEGDLTSAAQDYLEVPLDKQDAAKVSVCGSLIIYGHKITMSNSPNLVWHAPLAPNLTTVSLTLTFEDDYYDNWARAVLGSAVTDLTGCKFPRKGPIEGKPIKWSVSSGLEGHGSYDLTGSTTNDLGQAVATWRTKNDPVKQACRVFENQRDAVGATEAMVSGLLSGWSTVEAAVNFLNPNTGGQGNAPLTVLYYEVEASDTCHNE